MGVITGMMGAAPSLVWASGALFVAAFVILVPLAIWIYTLVFAFASLWFAHYALTALHDLRLEAPQAMAGEIFPAQPVAPHSEARLGASVSPGLSHTPPADVTDVDPRRGT
jgi:hypothetical protein